MRIFSAVNIENEELISELERVRDIIDLGFNTVPGDKMHITLQFFEDLQGVELEEVKDAVEAVSMQPFTAEIRGIGTFPSKDYIRVVWAGAESEKFEELHQQVSSHPIKENNDHDFHPHVTLARVKNVSPSKKRKLQKILEEFSKHRFGTLKVDNVKLFKSQLTSNGSQYELIHEEEL